MRLRAVAASEVRRLHSEAVPVEPLEGGFIPPFQQFLGDRPVGIAVPTHRKRRRLLDASFGDGDALRLRHAGAKLSRKVHSDAGEAFKEGIDPEERAAAKARLPRRLVGQSRRLRDVGNVIVVTDDGQDIAPRLNYVAVAVARRFHRNRPTQHNRRLTRRSLRHHGQRLAQHPFHEAIQLLRRENTKSTKVGARVPRARNGTPFTVDGGREGRATLPWLRKNITAPQTRVSRGASGGCRSAWSMSTRLRELSFAGCKE